jgi:hypothetical protein
MDGIEQRPARHLPGERDQPAHGQNESDVGLRPRGCREVNRHERTEAGLDIGDKEDEPVERPTAGLRRLRRVGRTLGGRSVEGDAAEGAGIIL